MQSRETNIPETEITFDFVRSSGPGGQNVNKVSSKAQLHWNVGASTVFSGWQKDLIRQNLKSRLTKRDEIVVNCDEERSQAQNKEKALAIFQELINRALEKPKPRIATKPSRGKKEERLGEKKHRSELKKERKKTEY